ncbi:MAG: hypothetical protein A2140_04465 [Candidatus Muproteobacteria bacterium RBG_16_62_13]|uniref:Uncharacterized protein n=1 Tax=Candidatus Muproteobacteria bacterium RBG_16_62_13 TaxID=1817756 RepID=A0A1F6T7X6_9PROT|nr:MAG: hypothetical protein A2140_04465 [Candidatus Muproteobacteria bacterium RBG_16_62_13]
MQRAARRRWIDFSKVLAKRLFAFPFLGDIFERGQKLVRRVITVDAQHLLALCVEEQDRRREPYLVLRGELLFGQHLAVEIGHLAVAPHVDADGVEVFTREFGNM